MNDNKLSMSVKGKADRYGAAECVVRFLLAFFAAFARVFGDVSPFAAALTAASGTGATCIFTLLGAAIGYMLGPSFMSGLKYISISLIIAAAGNIFKTAPIRERVWFMPAMASAMCIFVGIVFAFDAGFTGQAMLHLIMDAGFCGAGAYFYSLALSPWNGRLNFEYSSESGHTTGVLLLIGTMLLTLSNIHIAGEISVGRIAAGFVVMMFSYKGGAGTGCAAGGAIGVVMDAHAGGGLFFSAVYCLSGFASGVMSKHRRVVSVLAYIVTNGVLCAAFSSTAVPLYETLVASVAFMAIPNSIMSRFGSLIYTKKSGLGADKSREYVCDRIEQASLAFHDLYETVKSAAGAENEDGDIACVFDRAAASTCLNCENTTKCWFRNYETTKNALNDAAPKMMEQGKLHFSDLPDFFSENCLHYPEFIGAINSEVQALMYRRQYRSRLRNNQAAAFNQYADMSSILGELSNEIFETGGGEPFLENRLHKYFLSIGLQTSAAVFRDKGGRLHIELNGGAGTIVKDADWLDKLSAVVGMRLCTAQKPDRGETIYLLEAEPLAAAVGISCVKKKTGELSGDKGAYFKTDEGVLYVILSDGMGSGSAAAKYSSDAVRILERFLRSGVAAETAVRMLNDLMLLKNEDDIGTATVDLICIDLFTGETLMYKYGAAPSYIVKDSKVRRIPSTSLAAGLGTAPENYPDKIKLKLSEGCIAVMVSDGVISGDDKWLCELLAKAENPVQLSKQILNAASEQTHIEDDMTAYVIHITQRK